MSCQITLDDEIVNFEGGCPEKLADLLFFFDDFLAQKQKTLKKVLLDDNDLKEKHFNESCNFFSKIQFFSQEKTTQLKSLLETFKEDVDKFYAILSLDLEKILQVSQTFLKKLEDILVTLEQENYLLFTLQISLYSQWMQTFVQCLENKDVGTLFDLETYSLKPLLQETYVQSYGN